MQCWAQSTSSLSGFLFLVIFFFTKTILFQSQFLCDILHLLTHLKTFISLWHLDDLGKYSLEKSRMNLFHIPHLNIFGTSFQRSYKESEENENIICFHNFFSYFNLNVSYISLLMKCMEVLIKVHHVLK